MDAAYLFAKNLANVRYDNLPTEAVDATKKQVLDLFKGFRLEYFESYFKKTQPLWGHFHQSITAEPSASERGKIYFFVFNKR